MTTSKQNEHQTLLDEASDTYSVRLDAFEGPLDLLLHLIRKNEVDIYDIPIADITRQYLDYIKLLKILNLDIAGDFLLMASTLLHIKSKMLLPPDEQEDSEEEEGDPRAELIKRLLEYQQYKEAGQLIGARALLGREVFKRSSPEHAALDNRAEDEPIEVTLFELVDAFRNLLSRIPVASFHDVAANETFSIADCINEILSLLQERNTIQFDELIVVGEEPVRERMIVTFLALLELCRLKLIRIFQNSSEGAIWFVPAVSVSAEDMGSGK